MFFGAIFVKLGALARVYQHFTTFFGRTTMKEECSSSVSEISWLFAEERQGERQSAPTKQTGADFGATLVEGEGCAEAPSGDISIPTLGYLDSSAAPPFSQARIIDRRRDLKIWNKVKATRLKVLMKLLEPEGHLAVATGNSSPNRLFFGWRAGVIERFQSPT
ncbi:hypothetical protein PM082_024198 [Marasmius tenuissimus]|nr:hypothetical protein PM082_024198 [Marasmius tenuissimus]